MNQKIMKRMLLGALLAMALQCQLAMAQCVKSAAPPPPGGAEVSRCLPA